MTGRTKPNPTEKCSKQLRWEFSSCSPKFKLQTPRLHTGAAFERPETNEKSKNPPIPKVVLQQPTETITDQVNLSDTNNDSILYYTQGKMTVASRTLPAKGIPPLNYVVTTEHPPGHKTGNEPVPFINCYKNCTSIQESEQHVMTTPTGDTTIPPLTTTTPLIEEGLVRDEQTNEFLSY